MMSLLTIALSSCFFLAIQMEPEIIQELHIESYVGENVTLVCPFIFQLFERPKVEEEIKWTDGQNGKIFGTCDKAEAKWQDFQDDGFHFKFSDRCDENIVLVEARKPGDFSYICSVWKSGKEMEVMTFSVRVSLKCRIRRLPTCFQQFSHLVDINCKYRSGVQNSSDLTKIMRFERNNETFYPDALFPDQITLRENVSKVENLSQIYCVSNEQSVPCKYEENYPNVTLGIMPLVNMVFEGENATFECMSGGEITNHENEWNVPNLDVSRTSGTAESILHINNVTLADDGLPVHCSLNEGVLSAKAILKVQKTLLRD